MVGVLDGDKGSNSSKDANYGIYDSSNNVVIVIINNTKVFYHSRFAPGFPLSCLFPLLRSSCSLLPGWTCWRSCSDSPCSSSWTSPAAFQATRPSRSDSSSSCLPWILTASGWIGGRRTGRAGGCGRRRASGEGTSRPPSAASRSQRRRCSCGEALAGELEEKRLRDWTVRN